MLLGLRECCLVLCVCSSQLLANCSDRLIPVSLREQRPKCVSSLVTKSNKENIIQYLWVRIFLKKVQQAVMSISLCKMHSVHLQDCQHLQSSSIAQKLKSPLRLMAKLIAVRSLKIKHKTKNKLYKLKLHSHTLQLLSSPLRNSEQRFQTCHVLPGLPGLTLKYGWKLP